ncbi:MAG: integral rane sensor signal transduction histidine kinase [Clostridiaceae bacterium]|jgi:two-component system sensor histidine kinase CssS|nr:integral rane sensor signal transduction histidine kinase [Clostridiaceae bacterium]
MKRFQFKSLTMRIWTIFTAIILIIILSISLLYLFAYRKISDNAKIQDLKVAHDILLKSKSFDEPNRFDELRNLKGSNHFIIKIDSSNVPKITDINNNKPMQDKGFLPPPGENGGIAAKMWMTSFINSKTIYEKQFNETFNHMNFIFIISSVQSDKTGQTYLISYMPNMQDNNILYTVAIIGICFIAIGFLAAKLVANNISKPLRDLEDFTVRIAHKDWKEPIKVKSNDEIGKLAASMNRMQVELKHADEEEKMFLQSISHDLKTPVMVIMSHAEAIIDGIYIDTIEKNAEIIRDESICLEKKIKQILYLNTLDYVLENNSEGTEINLHSLILHIINRFEVINSKIEWDLNINEIAINANVDKIQVCIENILDNALRYAEEKISVSLKNEDSFAVLEIYNDGPNIPINHVDHVFDHLYKDKTGNFGLGLAICKKIIDFYNGEINVINREKGVSFIIKIPV